MREKIVVYILCSLLFFNTTSLALTSLDNNEKQMKNVFLKKTSSELLASSKWNRTFGGIKWEECSFVQQTIDGGYIMAGTTESYGAGNYDVWLIKTDEYGNEIWNRTFGGKDYDIGYSVQQTTDDGYIIIGTTDSFGSGSDVWLIKTDINGIEEWNRTFGGNRIENGYSVKQTNDKGYIITGVTWSYSDTKFDLWLIKTDSNGNVIWDKIFGGIDDDVGYSVEQTNDGGYIIAGSTESYGAGGGDFWLIKTDGNGTELWKKTLGGVGPDFCCYVQQTSDGGYILIGHTYSFGNFSDIWLVKTDSDGNELWNRVFGGNDYDRGRYVQQTKDGGYIITGETYSFSIDDSNIWLIKTDDYGYKIWDSIIGGICPDESRCVQQTSDGGYILTGYTLSYGAGEFDFWLIKTDDKGNATNEPPVKPTITGEDKGNIKTEYEYTFISTDKDQDNIYYCIEWGDNTEQVCIGPYPSGMEVNDIHKWSKEGNYTIRVKARDNLGAESDWSIFEVSMPKAYINNHIIEIIIKMLKSFTLLKKILYQIP